MICSAFLTLVVLGQLSGSVPPPIRSAGAAPVIEEAAPPVIINGKRADQLTDDELQEFLQAKVLNISHADGQVQLLRVAPGYPLTLSFVEQIQTVIVGDPSLVKTEKIGRNIVLSALEREGDTSIQVWFPGNQLRVYHVLIAPNFLTGLTAVRVAAFSSDSGEATVGLIPSSTQLNIRAIARVISNYDALVQEKALDPRTVKRLPVFRTNPRTGFTIYDLYRFAGGMLVVSFAYQNPYDYPIRYDESRLRLAVGNLLYVPDYTSLHEMSLPMGGATTGFTVIKQSGLRLDQPWEIAWK